MDNVSKALIIAGAILVSILLITIGLYIYNSNNGTRENAKELAEIMDIEIQDATEEMQSILNELDAENLTKIPNHTARFTNYWYSIYFPNNPKVLLEANTKYILSFDYTISSATKKLCCSVGYGKYNYNKDIAAKYYPDSNNGTFQMFFGPVEKFEYTDRNGNWIKEEEPYLHIRFARISHEDGGSASVKISNVKLKKVK